MKKNRHLVFPFKYENREKIKDIEFYENVKFKDNFGEFLKGEFVEFLTIDYKKNLIVKQEEEGEPIKYQNFKLIPI